MSLVNKTVQDFFQEANWQGLKLISNENQTSSSAPRVKLMNAHLGLTVEQYFTLNNWQGIAIGSTNDYREEIIEEQAANLSYSLKMSVREFFQRMIWQERKKSQVKIASPPPTAKPKASNSQTKKQLSLQDLSDLM